MREQDRNLAVFGLVLFHQRFTFVHANAIALPLAFGFLDPLSLSHPLGTMYFTKEVAQEAGYAEIPFT
jgi:hypothetical protein